MTDTSKVNRVEIIDWTKNTEQGGGRAYVFWEDEGSVDVQLAVQDQGRTLKVFITPTPQKEETE